MASDAIKTVTGNLGSVGRSQTQRAASVTKAYAHNASRITHNGTAKGDRLEFSQRGRMLSEAEGLAKKLEGAPDVRPEAIEEARKAIDSGELFSKRAIRQAANNLRTFFEQQAD